MKHQLPVIVMKEKLLITFSVKIVRTLRILLKRRTLMSWIKVFMIYFINVSCVSLAVNSLVALKLISGRESSLLKSLRYLVILHSILHFLFYHCILSILNILSYIDWNLFWDAKIFRKREIMTIFKLLIPQFLRFF